jgi:acetylornithine deacetylase/succinyl-diaminopimelate desuccinylase-like protein
MAREERDMRGIFAGALGMLLVGAGTPAAAQTPPLSPRLQAFRDIYKELVEINTTESAGDTLRAARAMAARLKAGGFPDEDVKVLSSAPRKGNLVARLHGTGAKKPILLMAHIDVVEAKREDWAFDPFTLQEADGYFRGRGTADDKAMAASFVANLIEYRKEEFKPDRDIILALTTDEELSDSPHDGARWLIENHRDLVDAGLAINEGGGGTLRDGKPVRNSIQLAEKIYRSYRLEVTDPGGHSASGRRDNAIYRLAEGLVRLSHFDFPVRLNAVTRGYFERVLETEQGEAREAIRALLAGNQDETTLMPLTARPPFNAQIRTTCVATLLEAGHAENALPQTARATVNCRILPDQSVEEVGKTLERIVADPKIRVTPIGKAVLSPPSPLDPDVMAAVEKTSQEMWPGVPVIPTMSGGYTDMRWTRSAGIPSYGVSGLFSDPGKSGVHGLNEQVGVRELYDSKEFLYRLVKRLSGSSD